MSTTYSFWKNSNPGEILQILSDIIKHYPGEAFKFNDIDEALSGREDALKNKTIEKAIERDIKSYLNKPAKTTLADVKKWDKVYSEELIFPDTKKTETVHFLFSDLLPMDDDIKLNLCTILNNSELARQLANVAMFIGKLGLQVSSQTISSKYMHVIEEIMGTNANEWVMQFLNEDDNKYFYLAAPAIKIFEIAKEYWVAV